MTKEEKQLLITDLSARLPYGVIVDIKYNKKHGSSDRLRICSEGYLVLNTDVFGLYIQDEIYLKPYLRPMESMTEEEYREFLDTQTMECGDGNIPKYEYTYKTFDWLNKKMFDYRGLIELGLALEAPKGMY